MNQYVWIALSLTFGVLAGGLPLWFITYDSLSFGNADLINARQTLRARDHWRHRIAQA